MSRLTSIEQNRAWVALAANIAVIASLGVFLVSIATPATEAVRVRNALLARKATAEDLNWTPVNVPDSFRLDTGSIPEPLAKVAASVDGPEPRAAGDQALRLAEHLASGSSRGAAIQASTVETYRRIRDEGAGYCADYTQVYNGLASAAGVVAREWGISFDRFSGDGHALNEFFWPRLGKWVLVDTYHAFYVTDRDTGVPLSVLEFRDRLASGDPAKTTRIVRLNDDYFSFENDDKLFAYFIRGVDQFYLWWGNNVFEYDANPLLRLAGSVSLNLQQAMAILLGLHPQIVIPETPGNEASIRDLQQLRIVVISTITAIVLLSMVLLLQLLQLYWRR
jgi:hypothetical protein